MKQFALYGILFVILISFAACGKTEPVPVAAPVEDPVLPPLEQNNIPANPFISGAKDISFEPVDDELQAPPVESQGPVHD